MCGESIPILLPLSSASTLNENFKMSKALQRKGGKTSGIFGTLIWSLVHNP